ncbi:hypothetical protein [Sphingomonas sp. IC081]|uniref:hypothetical protein n=1 Tax=Sphingomonas sp. IC081 TaxID=304378 RepID=UPI00115C18F6|nr:hypothetical protein [Sphingomonas sp. IC081]QDK32508.1 hypothetical protein DM450_06865 [Sphingomonas sp. IC081]
MGKRKFLGVTVSALIAAAGMGVLARPQACDYSIEMRFLPQVWAANLWRRISGQEQDCDPWSHVEADVPTRGILVRRSINAYAGPADIDMYIGPDGRGYLHHRTLEDTELGNKPPEAVMKALAEHPRGDSFPFEDKGLFLRVASLLAPLRHATGAPSDPDAPFRQALRGKVLVPCRPDGYHSAYWIDWGEDPYQDGSYFDNSSSYEDCVPMASALARLDRAKALFEAERERPGAVTRRVSAKSDKNRNSAWPTHRSPN